MSENTQLWDKVYGPVSARVENIVFFEPNSGCWLWGGALAKTGYGTMTVYGKTRMAHRASYEAYVGQIPEGLHIDHKCKVRCCVNPLHLEAVTVTENNRRSPKTVVLAQCCKNGHPFSGDNLQIGRQRRCRECSRTAALASYHRRKSR